MRGGDGGGGCSGSAQKVGRCCNSTRPSLSRWITKLGIGFTQRMGSQSGGNSTKFGTTTLTFDHVGLRISMRGVYDVGGWIPDRSRKLTDGCL